MSEIEAAIWKYRALSAESALRCISDVIDRDGSSVDTEYISGVAHAVLNAVDAAAASPIQSEGASK